MFGYGSANPSLHLNMSIVLRLIFGIQFHL